MLLYQVFSTPSYSGNQIISKMTNILHNEETVMICALHLEDRIDLACFLPNRKKVRACEIYKTGRGLANYWRGKQAAGL